MGSRREAQWPSRRILQNDDLADRFTILPLTPAIAWRSVGLDWAHKDPADRLICATALEHRLTLITHEQEITRWRGVSILW